MKWKRIFCFHNTDELVKSWNEIYMNGQGDCFPTTIGAFKCSKCEGIYDWFMPYGHPTVRAGLIRESKL